MDQPLWNFRADIWRDNRLSGNAVKLGLRMTDLFHKAFKHGDEFTFSANHAAKLLGFAEWETGHKYLSELTRRSYLLPRGLKGCPATCRYSFAEASYRQASATGSRQASATSSRQTSATGSRQTSATSCRRKPAHHISNSLREEMKVPMGRNSSLRSKGLKGVESAAAPKGLKGEIEAAPPRRLTLKERQEAWQKARAATNV